MLSLTGNKILCPLSLIPTLLFLSNPYTAVSVCQTSDLQGAQMSSSPKYLLSIVLRVPHNSEGQKSCSWLPAAPSGVSVPRSLPGRACAEPAALCPVLLPGQSGAAHSTGMLPWCPGGFNQLGIAPLLLCSHYTSDSLLPSCAALHEQFLSS